MNKGRVTVHVTTRDRHTEVCLLIESLRKQTFKNWDLIVIDDASGTPLQSAQFFMSLINRLVLEGHYTKVERNNLSMGVCNARNICIELDDFDNEFVCRLDDDVILQSDYLEKLLEVIDNGYDLASGVVPLLAMPEFKRNIKFVGDIINKHELDKKGNLVKNADDCGYAYMESVILPTHQFRTNCLYRKAVTDSGVRYPDFLTKVGFREEGFFSFQAIIKGFKIGVHTGAVAYHLQTQSGGCRSPTYSKDVQLDHSTFLSWIKKKYGEHGDFLDVYR